MRQSSRFKRTASSAVLALLGLATVGRTQAQDAEEAARQAVGAARDLRAVSAFTVTTEQTVNAANLWRKPYDLRSKVNDRDAGIPKNIAHRYTLRTTYVIALGDADAALTLEPAGCGGRFTSICWADHWTGELKFPDSGSQVRWELIDKTAGKTVASRSKALKVLELKQDHLTASIDDKVDFSGAQDGVFVRFAEEENEDEEKTFPLGGGSAIFFTEPFLDDLYRGAQFLIQSRGGNRYRLVGMQYGGETATGDRISVRPGAQFPGGVAFLNGPKNDASYAVGAPNGDSGWTNIEIIDIKP